MNPVQKIVFSKSFLTLAPQLTPGQNEITCFGRRTEVTIDGDDNEMHYKGDGLDLTINTDSCQVALAPMPPQGTNVNAIISGRVSTPGVHGFGGYHFAVSGYRGTRNGRDIFFGGVAFDEDLKQPQEYRVDNGKVKAENPWERFCIEL